MKVGFVGLGSQGGPIARRIARSGHALVACDVSAAAREAFDEPGVSLSSDPLDTARHVDVLLVCVRMDSDLVQLVAEGALFAALGRGSVCVIHSTVSPELCNQLSALALSHGVDVLDAGVSGGGDAALNGQLSIFVGGEPAAFARVQPLLASYGKCTWLGPSGRGMQGKLLNNLVSIANYGNAAAILELGEHLQFDREQLREALLAGSADGFALRAIPGLLRPERAAWLHAILGKDLEHAKALVSPDDAALAALLPAAESMIRRLAPAPSLASRYFAAMRARDLESLRALFAPDAVMSLPDGRTFEGRDAIADMFVGVFAAAAPSPICVREVEGPRALATEVETTLPGGVVRRTVNLFDLDDRGLIRGLRSYARA